MPDEAWQEYLDPALRDRAPRIERTDEGDFRVFEGQRTPINTLNNLAGKRPEDFSLNVRKLEDQRSGAWDPVERIKDMDADGVDAEVLYFGGPLASKDSELRLNSVRGYNRWLSDFSSHSPRRLLGMASIPVDTPELAVAELRFAKQAGLAGGAIPLFPAEGEYADAKWDVMWDAFVGDRASDRAPRRGPSTRHARGKHLRERTTVHDRAGDEQADDGRGRLRADLRIGDAALPRSQVHRGRVPDRLDLVLSSTTWTTCGRSTATGRRASWRRHRACTSSARSSPPSWRIPVGLRERHHIGIDNIMWASDYPHSETTWPNSTKLTDEWFRTFSRRGQGEDPVAQLRAALRAGLS